MKKFQKMLENASTIQYYKTILDNDSDIIITVNSHGYVIVCHDYDISVPTNTALFLLKDRKLKGGLATPMQRYYAYRALGLSKEPRISFECKLWSKENQAFKRLKVEDILTYEEETLLF